MKIAPDGLRAMRGLLDMSQEEFGDAVGISRTTISQFEDPNYRTLKGKRPSLSNKHTDKINGYIYVRGARFTEHGGAEWIPKGEVLSLSGEEGFRIFMDDVYEVAKSEGGDICIFNSRPSLWYKWLTKEVYEHHAERMQVLGDKVRVRIIVQEGEEILILNIAEHRYFPKDLHKEKIIYAYGPKLAFLDFSENDVHITVHNHREFADNYRAIFELSWQHSLPVEQQ